MHRILSDVICREYQDQFRDQHDYKHAMVLKFGLSIDYAKEDGYRVLELWIYAENNYVGVYTRENWTIRSLKDEGGEYQEGVSGWTIHAHHDSCWRDDGVGDVLGKFQDRINVLGGFMHWYEKVEVSKKLTEEFKAARLTRYNFGRK